MFENIISMGCACGVACSMIKYGLRSCVGPFDWYVSDFSSLLHFMETDFTDFLNRKHIKISERPNEFYDEKYDCYFANDVIYDFSEEWEEIYEKYQRRIKKFSQMIQYPTCFVRCIRDEHEKQYICENYKYILSVIKKSNQLNEIVFLGEHDLDIPFRYYPLKLSNHGDYSLIIEHNILFDQNYDILEFLCKQMEAEKIVKNLFFSQEKYLKRESGIKSRYALAVKLLQCKNEKLKKIPKDIVIYGGGAIGKAFFEKCKPYCHVECFIDQHPNEYSYEGIRTIHYADIASVRGKNFIVTPTYDMDKISKIILKYKPDANIIPLDKILE